MVAIADKNIIHSNRIEASEALSRRLMNDFIDMLRLVEATVRTERLVDATVGSTTVGVNTFATSAVISGGYTKTQAGMTVVITSSELAEEKRLKVVAIGAGGTPDITIDADVQTSGIATGDTYKIIYGVPLSNLGHSHNEINSECVPTRTLGIHLMVSDMYGAGDE